MGAIATAETADSELRIAGGRPRRLRPRGVDVLTPGQLRVAELAAAGRSNKEIAQSLFVTLRTVETHLTEVYRRLAIGSREQLAAALRTETARPLRDVVTALEDRREARESRVPRSPDPTSPPLRRLH
ncbi:MAG: helix-turn-helix transcriptional regulator [Actinobacteria bacterium]|nr:helix-turn-helix transcriptional regulator [Actinomycetota bacterium]